MPKPIDVRFVELDLDALAGATGRVAVTMGEGGKLDTAGRRVSRLMKGALKRFAESEAAGKLKPGEAREMAWPAGMEAEGVVVARIGKGKQAEARRAGAAIGKAMGEGDMLIVAPAPLAAEMALGAALRAYSYDEQKGGEPKSRGTLTVATTDPAKAEEEWADKRALAEGVLLTRDLVNAPANVLTTVAFAERLEQLRDLGVEVEVMEEDRLEELGMRTLLAVGQGSEAPSKVVVMHWKGGEGAPLALVGKGVVFDTGGISMKPAGGMEDMTMDMGGAGTVAGAMHAIAARKAKANVVGLVGLVENMPDGKAQRPGDVVKSMKGDTVEVINTDAEGRLVLADVMWHAQEAFEPAAMVDLATLTGAIIIGLGHEKAGVFSNDDEFCEAFLKAADAEGEGAWRMPLGAAYDKQLKSRIADMKNVGGRPAGSITAAQFLQRFVKEGVPWIHLDIAGVASVKSGTDYAPEGATGWGVLALDRLVRDRFEAE